ncbi:hypothetical protein [Curtobacterium sp. MCBD17_040]|uniref:hypothetical protein n=1 Tax=Curtobacterium sp. MCBD17_040 TaxID=2175674 RepID=UPI0011B6075D|nr:hypothetical protein [Curtobacterium sp. MCBD17_040]WIB65559.1 hypothetical protein DEI94_19485 [Curtobacterium sp. MCBD17_040]
MRRWIWVVWIGTGVFVVAQALVVPIILNYVLIAVWLLASIAQLIVKFRQRRKGAGPKQSR